MTIYLQPRQTKNSQQIFITKAKVASNIYLRTGIQAYDKYEMEQNNL